MPFSQDDLSLKVNSPTLALKSTDDVKFSQLLETTKDVMVLELRKFFATTVGSYARLAEILNIEKYGISQMSTDPTENMITVMRQYPDILQKLPLVSVTGSSGSRKSMGIGGAFTAHTQYAPRLRTTLPEPYDLTLLLAAPVSPRIGITTRPDAVNDVASTLVFVPQFFPTPGVVTAAQLAKAINFQAIYASARAVTVGADTFLEILADGPLRMTIPGIQPVQSTIWSGGPTPNRIAVTNTSTAGLLTELGLTVGQEDDSDNALRPPTNRYVTAANFTLGFDVGATSDNERTEITDLFIYFFNMIMDDRNYTFFGEHVFTEPTTGLTTERFFQIVLGDWSMSGEADIPRPDREMEEKIYVNRFNIPVQIFDYVDRVIPANLIPPTAEVDETLPGPS